MFCRIPFSATDVASSSLTTSTPIFLQKLGDGQLIDSAAALYLHQLQQSQQLKDENNEKYLLDKCSFPSPSTVTPTGSILERTSTDLNKEKSLQQTFNDGFPFSVSSNIDSGLQPGISPAATAAMFGPQHPFTISQLQVFKKRFIFRIFTLNFKSIVADNQQQSSTSPKFLTAPSAGLLSLGTPMPSNNSKLDANTQVFLKYILIKYYKYLIFAN